MVVFMFHQPFMYILTIKPCLNMTRKSAMKARIGNTKELESSSSIMADNPRFHPRQKDKRVFAELPRSMSNNSVGSGS